MSNAKGTYTPNGARIRNLRRKKGWSQQVLADKAGVEKKTIYNIEKNKEAYSVTLELISEALGVTMPDIVCAENDLNDRTADRISASPPQMSSVFEIDSQVHFADLIAYHCSVFAGRAREIAQIRETISAQESGYIFVEGLSGFGKTALLSHLTQSLVNPVYHFMSQAMSGSSDMFDPNREDCFLAGLCRQLRETAHRKGAVNVNDLRGTYLSLLTEEGDAGETTLVIIDAVDEVEPNRNFLRGLFPHRLPRNTFVIFSARTIGDRNYLPYLGLSNSDISYTVTLDRFDVEGTCALLKRAGGKAAGMADEPESVAVLYQVTEGDPFYLRFVVEDIRDGLITADNIADAPRGLSEYLDLQFELLSKSATSQQQRDVLGYILHAKGPLSRSHLSALVRGLDPINFDVSIQGIRRFLIEHNGAFTFCHERFRQYFEDKVSA